MSGARWALALAPATLSVALSACGSSSPATTTPDPFVGQPDRPVDVRVVRGGRLYVSDGCQACHSVDGRRLTAVTFRGLGARRSDRRLLQAVTHHPAVGAGLPAVAALAQRPGDARALVDFIESVTAPG